MGEGSQVKNPDTMIDWLFALAMLIVAICVSIVSVLFAIDLATGGHC